MTFNDMHSVDLIKALEEVGKWLIYKISIISYNYI
jgi:hypothetical protein